MTNTIYEVAPDDWDDNGLPYGAACKCSRCGRVGYSTITFDFYADKAGDPLVCETCQQKEIFDRHRAFTEGGMREPSDCETILHQILTTWDPPLHGAGSLVACVQTASVQAIAFCMADEFPWENLTPTQRTVVRQGLDMFDECLRIH